ncbi:MAG: xanthine dehydrogenase family protein, partial [Alphaproteobacteria bacterium]|nr:xanthine dehydrogenase family protein [Alphaproteobacteria bacterium]
MREHKTERFVGQRMPRREDRRLLIGQGQYVADLALPGMLHAAFIRSSVAHGKIRKVDLSRAAAAPGVAFVLSGAEFTKQVPPARQVGVPMPAKWLAVVQHKVDNPGQPALAFDKVRYVGEAVAVIVADSRYAAEDAAALAAVDIEPLPPVLDVEAALKPGARLVHDQIGHNVNGEMAISKGDVDAALARAPHKIKRRYYHHRYAAMPMECRGVLSQYDPRTASITIWSSTQMVHHVRGAVASCLGLPEARVRCIAPDVGGGFGVKGHPYTEEQVIAFLSRALGRPIKWIEDRYEHLISACHSRDQFHDVEIGFDDDGRILALRDRFLMDQGAFNPLGLPIACNTLVHLPGPYKIPHLAVSGRLVFTTKTPNAPYRGAGRPEAVQAMEGLIDLIARRLRLEPAEVRRRNMVRPEEMPYQNGIIYRDGEPIVFDGGDYPGALDKALDALGGLAAFRERQRVARHDGRYLGLGIGCYNEGTGVGPFEGATVRIETTGKIHVASGACPQGQGMETIFAQVVADLWKVDPDDVIVSLADTAAIPMGFGTIASRSTVTVSAALHHATERLSKKAFAIAAGLLECAEADLELRPGGVGIVGVPGKTVSLAALAQAARPGWDRRRPDGMDAGLEDTYYYEPPTVTWAYAVHAAIVDVDIETGRVKIEDYAVAHDCGVTVNPMLVEGQVVGGTVQGIGGALLEELPYNADGQPLAVSFMDYLVPTASDVPEIRLVHQETPSPLNPLGVKGLGEGGAIAPPVTIA